MIIKLRLLKDIAILAGSLIWFTLASCKGQETIYVAVNGSDTNPGTINKPLKTITHAVSLLKPGMTCYVRGGKYHEEVTLTDLEGTPSKPILITNYQNEEVILDGTILLHPKWEKVKENIYAARINEPVWQLFADGKMFVNARWPNADYPFENFDSCNWWDRHATWCKALKDGTGYGYVTEDGGKNLAGLNISFQNALAILNVNSMTSYAGVVTKHEAGSPKFEYRLSKFASVNEKQIRLINKNASHAYFYFEGGLQCLDLPYEWYFDKGNNTIYVYGKNISQVNARSYRGKTQSLAFLLKDCSYIKVKGMHFFATTFNAENCVGVHIEDCRFSFPSYSKRHLGDFSPIIVQSFKNSKNLPVTGNVFRNNIVEYTEGAGLIMNDGINDTVDNNYFHYIDITVVQGKGKGIHMGGEQYPVFTNNTFDIGGASAVLKAGLFPLTVLNEFTHFGYLQDDGCAIQIASGGQIGSITTQNWIHDTPKGGIRFDGPQYEDPYIQGKLLMGAMVRNVVWNVMGGGLMVKGDDHRIYNNTTFNTDKAGIRSIAWKRKPGQDYKTILRNNIASDIIGSKRGTSENHPPAGIADHNWTEFKSKKTVKTVLRDPENLDFRPAPNAEIIDAGIPVPQETLVNPKVIFPDFTKDFTVGKVSDIGAYEYGCKNYWIPGFRHSTASTPIPPDKSVTAKSDADLMWKPAYQSKIFMVYFGIEKDKLKMVSKQKVNIYDPGKLMPGKTYYWRIDCSNGEELNKGEIWSFTVFNNKRKSEKK